MQKNDKKFKYTKFAPLAIPGVFWVALMIAPPSTCFSQEKNQSPEIYRVNDQKNDVAESKSEQRPLQKRSPTPRPVIKNYYFWHPPRGHATTKLSTSYAESKYDLKNLGGFSYGSATLKNRSENFEFQFGVSDSIAFGIEISPSGKQTAEVTPTSSPKTATQTSGVGDLFLNLLVDSDHPSYSFIYGLQVGIPMAGAKMPRATLNSTAQVAALEGNNSSGGPSAALFLGYANKLSLRSFAGSKISYKYKFQRAIDAQDGTTTIRTGGSELLVSGFYESHHGSFFYVPQVELTVTDASYDTNSGKNSTSERAISIQGALDLGYRLSKSLSSALKLGYLYRMESKVDTYMIGYNMPVFGLNIRFDF